jgi:hypothetical protein
MSKKRKTYTAFEKVLALIPKLSMAECMIIHDVIETPTSAHLWYVKYSLKHGRLSSHNRTVDPNKPIKIKDKPYKPLRPMTISDKPIP